MFKIKHILTLLLVCATLISFAQKKEKKPKDERAKFIFTFDSRNSSAIGERVGVQGLKLGLQFKGKYRIGFGFYELKKKIVVSESNIAGGQLFNQFNFKHASVYYERILYHDFKWDFSLPVSLGTGNSFSDTFNTITGKTSPEVKNPDLGVFTLGLAGHYKVKPWIGLGTGIGYRQLISSHTTARKTLSAPYYSIKVKIFLGYLYKGIFKPEKVQQEIEEYKNNKK